MDYCVFKFFLYWQLPNIRKVYNPSKKPQCVVRHIKILYIYLTVDTCCIYKAAISCTSSSSLFKKELATSLTKGWRIFYWRSALMNLYTVQRTTKGATKKPPTR